MDLAVEQKRHQKHRDPSCACAWCKPIGKAESSAERAKKRIEFAKKERENTRISQELESGRSAIDVWERN
jgi:hypothetical protein